MSLPIDLGQLINYGVLGVVLCWFMLRMEKKLDLLTEAITDLKDVVKEKI